MVEHHAKDDRKAIKHHVGDEQLPGGKSREQPQWTTDFCANELSNREACERDRIRLQQMFPYLNTLCDPGEKSVDEMFAEPYRRPTESIESAEVRAKADYDIGGHSRLKILKQDTRYIVSLILTANSPDLVNCVQHSYARDIDGGEYNMFRITVAKMLKEDLCLFGIDVSERGDDNKNPALEFRTGDQILSVPLKTGKPVVYKLSHDASGNEVRQLSEETPFDVLNKMRGIIYHNADTGNITSQT